MAGVKGKSGGARANAGGARPNSGGARPGAGKKPRVVPPVAINASPDPQKFLLDLMNDPAADPRMRLDAAKALMPFMHGKPGAGKKDERVQAAKKVSTGKFAPAAPPRLIVNNK